ncbi:MAG: GTP cyclohydrolase I FolE, partial [Bacteroidetes bacterium]
MKYNNNREEFESIGNDHIETSKETTMRNDAFKLSKEEKID